MKWEVQAFYTLETDITVIVEADSEEDAMDKVYHSDHDINHMNLDTCRIECTEVYATEVKEDEQQ